ncbi:MAG: M56 family metallopeptidase [Bryobacteraceae bacterium]|jgi:beta-lactamase regulating signal transducer with metallopeptidase domain/protocatechuate 3,4-dioxygenase beta subunit
MTALGVVLRQPWVARLGWTLVHFLWQGTVIAAAYAAARGIGGRLLSARGRYALACTALAAMAAAPPVTFLAASFAVAPPGWWPGAAPPWQQALPWLALAWAAGVALFSVRLFGGWRMTTRLRRVAVTPPPPEWRLTLVDLMDRMRVSAPARLLVSSLAPAPMVVGWMKPVVLMPVELLTGLRADQVRALLAHELAHILRRDYLVNILQSVTEAALFYHPAVWWVSERIRAEREACCDDLAVEATGDALVYAGALADLDTRRRARLRLAAAATGGSLVSRIRRLLGEAEPVSHALPGAGIAWTMSLLWLAGLSAVLAHGAHTTAATTPRPFVPPTVTETTPATFQIPPPPPAGPVASPLTATLMFDPFFALPVPQAAQPDAEKQLASVSGVVSTSTGKPVAGAQVALMPTTPSPVSSAAGGAKTAVSGPDGAFTIDKVPPGSYRMMPYHPRYLNTNAASPYTRTPEPPITLTAGQTMDDVKLTLLEPATISGMVVDSDGDPVAHMDMCATTWGYYQGRRVNMRVASASSGDDGRYKVQRVPPGTYLFRANSQANWNNPARVPTPAVKPGEEIYDPAMTYYGGTSTPVGATHIDVAPGQNLTLPTIKMLNLPLVHVRGKVVGNPSLLADARVVRYMDVPGESFGWSYGADIHADGSYDMTNMFPIDGVTLGVYNQKLGLLGWTVIAVGKKDIEGVVIDARARPLNGSIRMEAADTPAAGPKTPLRIILAPVDSPSAIAIVATSNPEGSFAIPNLAPGRYVVEAIGMPSGSYLKSVRLNGLESLKEGIDWGGSGSLDLVVSPTAATLDGVVLGEDGKPVAGTVTLVPDRQYPGRATLYPSAKADAQGRFRLQSVTPGDYRVYAWEEIEDTAHWDRQFIRLFPGAGESVHLEEGGSATVTVKRVPAAALHDALRSIGL